jgi:hypothetical protein
MKPEIYSPYGQYGNIHTSPFVYELDRKYLRIRTCNARSVAYIEDTLGLNKPGDAILLIRQDSVDRNGEQFVVLWAGLHPINVVHNLQFEKPAIKPNKNVKNKKKV